MRTRTVLLTAATLAALGGFGGAGRAATVNVGSDSGSLGSFTMTTISVQGDLSTLRVDLTSPSGARTRLVNRARTVIPMAWKSPIMITVRNGAGDNHPVGSYAHSQTYLGSSTGATLSYKLNKARTSAAYPDWFALSGVVDSVSYDSVTAGGNTHYFTPFASGLGKINLVLSGARFGNPNTRSFAEAIRTMGASVSGTGSFSHLAVSDPKQISVWNYGTRPTTVLTSSGAQTQIAPGRGLSFTPPRFPYTMRYWSGVPSIGWTTTTFQRPGVVARFRITPSGQIILIVVIPPRRPNPVVIVRVPPRRRPPVVVVRVPPRRRTPPVVLVAPSSPRRTVPGPNAPIVDPDVNPPASDPQDDDPPMMPQTPGHEPPVHSTPDGWDGDPDPPVHQPADDEPPVHSTPGDEPPIHDDPEPGYPASGHHPDPDDPAPGHTADPGEPDPGQTADPGEPAMGQHTDPGESDPGMVVDTDEPAPGMDADPGQHEGGQYEGGQYEGGQYEGGQYEGGPTDGGHYEGGQPDGGQYDGGQYDGGQPDGGQYDGSQYDGGQYDGGQYDGGGDGGQYDGGQYDGGGDGGQYDGV